MKTVKSKVSVNIGSIQVRRCYVDRLIKKVLRKIQNKADFMGILLQQLSKVHMPKTFYGVKVVIINGFFLCVYLYRYASLYFCCAIEEQDNELITLEVIHRFVELLDKYFGSVCELDIIFNFEKAYFILDEFLMGGEIQDTSKKSVLKAIEQADLLQEEDESPRSVLEEMGLA
uniref:Adaptor related protein complex 1 subunit sigma 1 n=1 Tax=Gasterosteus aculeatus aculeatus TaxID=481459 RepID=A0AAQ4PPG0_GASAC